MINNINDLFIKYKINKNPKSKILDLFIEFLKKELNIELQKEDFKFDIKNNIIYLNKNNSSLKFFLKSKISEEKKVLIEKELGISINI